MPIDIQEFDCKESGCKEKVYYPDDNPGILTIKDANLSFKLKNNVELVSTTAYLKCKNQHQHPYTVNL